ncbi:hypothetical protein MJD09_12575, partial [bacterium]|nr:hypothetical protein [bacterium]
MRQISKTLVLLMTMTLVTGLVLSFNGCTTNSPLASRNEDSVRDGLNMVRIGDGSQILSKGVIKVSELVTPEMGGELVLNLGVDTEGNSSREGENKLEIKHKIKKGLSIKLKVLPGSVNQPTRISLK